MEFAAAAWGDYDKDGKLDLILSGSAGSAGSLCKIYHNNGDGTFSDAQAGLPGVYSGAVAWADYDNDTYLDFAISGVSNAGAIAKVYRNNQNGTFSDIGAGLLGQYSGSIQWGDYDYDGDLDLLLSGSAGTRIYKNNGGAFVDINASVSDVYQGAARWADIDGDNDLDIAMTGYSNGAIIAKIYRNNGDNTFSEVSSPVMPVWNGDLDWGDYDKDGDEDLLLTGCVHAEGDYVYHSRIYRNNGNSTFTDIDAGLTGVCDGSAEWGDYDNDGDLDILLSGYTDYGSTTETAVYLGEGTGTFSKKVSDLPGLCSGNTTWGDYDNDGDLDVLLAGVYGGRNAGVYRNQKVFNLSGSTHVGSNALTNAIIDAGPIGTRTTDADGSYLFARIIEGTTLTITPSKAGYTFIPNNVSLSLSSDSVRNFTATLNKHSISGKVAFEGDGLGGVSVDASTLGKTTTDDSGHFSLANIPYGSSYTIVPVLRGFLFEPSSQSGTLTKDTTLNFTASRADLTISGIVADPNGPLPGFAVKLTGSSSQTVTTDNAGVYTFTGLSKGQYLVTPADSDFSTSPGTHAVALANADVANMNFMVVKSILIGASINAGEIYTNDPNVSLVVVPPPAATTIRVSNDGGFRSYIDFTYSNKLSWQLPRTGPERLPKTVYVRFIGPGIDSSQTYTDDIILDQLPPTIVNSSGASLNNPKKGRLYICHTEGGHQQTLDIAAAEFDTHIAHGDIIGPCDSADVMSAARFAARAKKPVRNSLATLALKIKARDSNSGVSKMQFAKSNKPITPWLPYRSSFSLTTKRAGAVFIRVKDAAGNISKWNKVSLRY